MDFVLVHGTSQSPSGWVRLIELLAARGHRAVAVDLPVDAPELSTADYAAIAAAQAAELDRPVAVAHSAAGLLLPALAEAVDARHLVWLGALVPDLVGGRTMVEQLHSDGAQMFTPDWHSWSEDVVEFPAISSYFLFHDCDVATLRWALSTLRTFQPRAVFSEHPTLAAPVAPSTYVVPIEDRTLTPTWMRAAARQRLNVEPIEVPGGHCPHVSRPTVIADLLAGVG